MNKRGHLAFENKLGQLTIFIIIAILIVGVIAIVFSVFNNKITLGKEQMPTNIPEIAGVKAQVNNCLILTSEDAVSLIGEQGGYYALPEKTKYLFIYAYPYYMDVNENLAPSQNMIEKELGNYTENNIGKCLDFETFKEKGVDASAENPKASVSISQSYIDFNVIMDVNVKKGNSSAQISEFSSRVMPVRIPEILKLANEIVNEGIKDPKTICITCINEFADSHNMKADIIETEDRGEIIYKITDSASNFSGSNYEFKFAAKYNFPQCKGVMECLNALR